MITDTKIKEIPMLFKDSMVAAIMSGTKTETRRLVFGENDFGFDQDYSKAEIVFNPEIADPKADDIVPMTLKGACIQFNDGEHIVKHNYGTEGDVIWVRESWRPWYEFGEISDKWIQFRDLEKTAINAYDLKWFDKKTAGEKYRWQPNMFLYRRYARTFLKRTFTKVERLQDITEEGAIAEGIGGFDFGPAAKKFHPNHYKDYSQKGEIWNLSPIESYRSLWESINGKGSWDLNPWVIVIGFKKIDNYVAQ